MSPEQVPSRPDHPSSDLERDRKRISRAAGMIIAALLVAALYFASEVLVPITLAALLTFILAPFVNLLRRARIPRVPATIVAVILTLSIILGIGALIGTQIAQLAGQLPQYQATFETKLTHARDTIMAPLLRAAARFESRSNQNAPNTPAGENTASQNPPGQNPAPPQVQQPSFSPLQIGAKVVAPILHPIATIVIMLVVTMFALLYREDLRDRAIRLLGSGDLSRTTNAMDDAAHRLSRYFLTQLAINCAFGVVIAIGTYFIGVPHPILWGVLGAVLRFVPYIGAWIAAAFPVLVAAVSEPGWSMALMTAGLYAVTEFFAGQFLEPLLYGHSTGLSPIAVIVAAIFWTWLWGPIGLIISTPLTLCAVVIGSHFEQLSFLSVLLGSQPALSPAQTLYQRLLADDLDEAHEQAEEYLSDHELVAYYDEIVIPSLQLAAADVSLGRLAPASIPRLREAFEEFAELAFEAAGRKPTETHKSPKLARSAESNQVLCLPGRGPFDSLATLMLSQLFRQGGIEATNSLHDAASRRKVGSLELKNIAVVCVLYLELSGTPANVRFLIRRLRERNGQTKLVLGLLQKGAAATPEQSAKLGADEYVSSLESALSTAMKLLETLPPSDASAAQSPPRADRQEAPTGADSEEQRQRSSADDELAVGRS